jgi:DNA invertase Pin-like site-specific DNA recombinase
MPDALGYVRVSSEEQADSGLGLEAQHQRIAAYCAMKGLRLAELFEDAGVSGGKPLASRPAGSQLLAAANKSKALVIVAKLDRLFRSVADAANVIADFEKKGIQMVAMRTDTLPNPAGLGFAPVASCR